MARRGGPTRAPRPRPLYASNEPVWQEHVQGDPEFVHVPEPPFRPVEPIAFGKRSSVPVLDPREQMASLRDRGIGCRGARVKPAPGSVYYIYVQSKPAGWRVA